MKIISGNFKGSNLISPKGLFIRPTSNRAKEMIFNTLNSYIIKQNKNFSDYVVIDLFCGTGSLGIEALSRGAKKSFFIDNSDQALNICKMNCRNLNLERQTEILKINIIQCKNQFDHLSANIFFCDPPYNSFDTDLLAKRIHNFLSANSVGVLELAKTERIREINGFDILKSKIISNSKFYFLKKI